MRVPPTRHAALLLWASVCIAVVLSSCIVRIDATLPERFASQDFQNHPCKNNGECKIIPNAKCNISSGLCICEVGFSPTNKSACGKLLGDPCDGMCDAHNSRCSNRKVCSCEDGLAASRDRSFCYGYPLMYEDACDHNDNCTSLGEHMQCNRFKCQCKEKYVRRDAICMEKIDQLDEKCDFHSQVCHSSLEGFGEPKRGCRDGFCKCKNRFAPHNGICKEKIGLLGVPCNESLHVCYLESDGKEKKLHCKHGLCQCKDEFALDEGKCKKKIGTLGSKCISDDDICYLDSEGYHPIRHCSEGVCQCKKGFRRDGAICKQKISRLGARCNTSSDVCYFEEDGELQKTHCKNGVCECKVEFALKDSKCQKAVTCGTACIGPAMSMFLLGLTIWYFE